MQNDWTSITQVYTKVIIIIITIIIIIIIILYYKSH